MITTMDRAISGQIASLITDAEGEQVKYTICDLEEFSVIGQKVELTNSQRKNI